MDSSSNHQRYNKPNYSNVPFDYKKVGNAKSLATPFVVSSKEGQEYCAYTIKARGATRIRETIGLGWPKVDDKSLLYFASII